MKNKKFAILAALFCLASFQAHALDSVSVEAGSGSGVDMWRLGAQWKWQKKWFTGGDWHVGGYWDAQIGQWNGSSNITDFGLTPTFRLERTTGLGPYVEGAIGFHYLTEKQITSAKRFGSNFQFGDHVGAGYRFGDKGRLDLGLRFQHLSNAGIKKPNPGINFTQLRFQYHFD